MHVYALYLVVRIPVTEEEYKTTSQPQITVCIRRKTAATTGQDFLLQKSHTLDFKKNNGNNCRRVRDTKGITRVVGKCEKDYHRSKQEATTATEQQGRENQRNDDCE